MSSILVTLISDASYEERTQAAGWHFWYKSTHASSQQTGAQFDVPNNTAAEFLGIVEGLLEVNRVHAPAFSQVDVVVQCDNVGALSMLQVLPNAAWAKTSKLRQGPAGQHTLPFNQRLLALVREANMGRLWLKWVQGHTRDRAGRHSINRLCDRHAGEARKRLQDIPPPPMIGDEGTPF